MLGLFKNSLDNKQKIINFYIYSNNQVTERYVRVLVIKENSILALTNGNRLSDDDFVFISRAGKIRNDHVAFHKALIRMIEKAKV